MKKVLIWFLILSLTAMLSACSASSGETTSAGKQTLPGGPGFIPANNETEEETTAAPSAESSTAASSTEVPSTSEAPTAPSVTQTQPPTSATPSENGYVICLDAGHQGKANTDKEPLGPGSAEMKTKVSTGTQGRTSGVPEYIVTLQVALKLQKVLEERGYTVLMTRTSHDVNISNVERAEMANNANVDAFVRLHCNGVDNSDVNGLLALCQTKDNPWNGAQYAEYKRLCQCIVDAACKVTGAKNMGIQETDAMTGINWCKVPTSLVEMGFMTNPEEDMKLVSDAYQDLLAEGIAEGIDAFFGISR